MTTSELNPHAPGMIGAYAAALQAKGFDADPAQMQAVERLETLYQGLMHFKTARGNKLRRMISPPAVPRGVYFWGGVGRGKSFIMDCFFAAVPYKRKKRIHFHAFMHQIHAELRQHAGKADPLVPVSERIAKETRLLCFDEFHVSDIADAMILGRLLELLFEKGVIFVMTSNYPPDNLYPNGLQRMNFLPTIALIKQKMDVMPLDGGQDYRLRKLEVMPVYHVPHDSETERAMAEYFEVAATMPGTVNDSIEINNRQVQTVRLAPGVVWFDFFSICGDGRAQADYLELVREYHTILVSNIPVLEVRHGAEARRFTWLVDVCYDHRVKLIISAATYPDDLYVEGPNAHEFFRTASRLTEMQSREYLALPHLVEIVRT
ncbi:cell division protein ZapE [Fluviibacter phosphoraccumulans]|uniref:Cell division protein ZapE n=1 Tax=Fluviibacter phosphoraccumulans TaxID=1751046 RepID=A0A679HSD2_9RHOO|nr:cell division protein ZapE [Fluviibacter phosphoraccumulans]BBU69002.1 cell division protein ZapE [Fluviibacter phosphoraccumulans]BCA64908.1 cell division protein ZapE [Fluviibacter phosphoraccumulans]